MNAYGFKPVLQSMMGIIVYMGQQQETTKRTLPNNNKTKKKHGSNKTEERFTGTKQTYAFIQDLYTNIDEN